MEIKRVGSQASVKGPAEWFTGIVRIDPLFLQANDSSRATGASVTFEPGARTAWHSHPLGQTLIVTAGCGWVQHEGGPIEEIRPGDVVRFMAGEKHWHGASATMSMTHIAIQEELNGSAVEWMEKVSGRQYGVKSDQNDTMSNYDSATLMGQQVVFLMEARTMWDFMFWTPGMVDSLFMANSE